VKPTILEPSAFDSFEPDPIADVMPFATTSQDHHDVPQNTATSLDFSQVSPQLNSAVVRSAASNSSRTDNHFSARPYYREPEKGALGLKEILGVARRRWPLVLGLACLTFAASTAWTLTRKPIYSTNFQLLVRPVDANPNLATITENPSAGVALQSGAGLETMVAVLRTPKVMEPALAALQRDYPGYTLQELYDSVSIGQTKGSDILVITVTDGNPGRAKAVADQLGKVYINYSDFLNKSSLNQGISFVDRQLPTLQARVQSLQKQLADFQQRYTLVDPVSSAANLTGQLSTLQQRQEDTQTSLTETRATYANLRRQLGNRAPSEAITASTMSTSVAYQGLLAKLREAEIAVAQASVTYQPDAPQMEVVVENRDKLLRLLEIESKKILGNKRISANQASMTGIQVDLNSQLVQVANTLQSLQTRAKALSDAEARLRKNFELYPDLSRRHTDLQRELKIATASLERFLSTRESLEIKAAQQSHPWQLLSAAPLPGAPISPNIPRNLTLGLVGALLMGGGAAVLADKLRDVFHSVDDLRGTVALPLLGIVPYQAALSRQRQANLETSAHVYPEDGRLSDETYVSNGFTESFRSLYSNLRFLDSEMQLKSLVVSSATPAEGKSTTAYNLAVNAAAMGQRVLLVDADLRRPSVHEKAGLQNREGLSNVITMKVPVREVLHQSPKELNLYVMTAGTMPPDPTRLFSSPLMERLMQELQQVFDLVIYDAPPILGFADSLLLSAQTNGCLMVVGLGYTERVAVREALEQCRTSHIPMLGISVNCRLAHTQDPSIDRLQYAYS
jgi:polysaccharide biosynthesis transport protein